jgi:phosphatidylinositol kinase/protein kinase (PI-3  family)
MIYLDFDERLLIQQKEAVPFRLSLDIQHLLSPFFINGPMNGIMTACARVLSQPENIR